MSERYFDLSNIREERPDYGSEGDPPGGTKDALAFSKLMLAELDKPHDGLTDAQHVVERFNDALAGLLHGLSVRVPPGRMEDVVNHLLLHAQHTMCRTAEIEDDHHASDVSKGENENEIRRSNVHLRSEKGTYRERTADEFISDVLRRGCLLGAGAMHS